MLARGDEPPCHQVNGGDVISVQSMTEAERVGEDGGAGEVGVEVEDDADGCPEEGVYQDKEGNDADGGEGEDA
ncbi:hypothetical protein V494_01490 [Pseudogymnoascus sp. VKM F-4513 (FW-928)]|nr:hypothetical protein V494_01490 [Pseudogymnoascus sp. VKM F-4513 (FW-928)]